MCQSKPPHDSHDRVVCLFQISKRLNYSNNVMSSKWSFNLNQHFPVTSSPACLTMVNSNLIYTQNRHHDIIRRALGSFQCVCYCYDSVTTYVPRIVNTHTHTHAHTDCRSPIIRATPRNEWVSLTPKPRLMWTHWVVDWSVEKPSLHCLSGIRNVEKSGWHGQGQLDKRQSFKWW